MEATSEADAAGSSSSGLGLLQRLLHWSGTMRRPGAGRWSSLAFYPLSAAASAAIALFLCSQGAAIWREGARDLDRLTLMLSTFNTIATWLFRLGHIAVHEHQFHYLSFQMERDFKDFLNPRDVPLLQASNQAHRRFVLSYLWFGVVLCMVWTLFPVATFGAGPDGLPFIMALPYDVSPLHAFIPTWIFGAFITVHVTMMTIISDTFNVSLMAQLRFQLVVLNEKIINLTTDIETPKSPLTKEEYITTKSAYESVKHTNIHHRLRQNLLHHQVIIRNTEMLENCIGGILLAQCLSIGAAVSFQLFQVAVSTQSLVQAGKFSCYLTVVLVELFMYCWFGDDLITESENVALAAYTAVTSLQGFPAADRRSLLIAMTRAHRPLRITAGGLFPFCRESFVSIVNMSYSYFAILRNFKDD